MSAADIEQITEAAERPFLRRTFAAEVTAGDGRTLDVRVVPYGEPATVDDGRGPYQEEFVLGAFDGQMDVAHRVFLNFEHQRGIAGIVGKGLSLRDSPDGLHGSFRVFENPDGDKALMLVNEGVLGGVSLEFLAKKSVRTVEGVVRRVKAHLDAVALCRTPAYATSLVLGVRQESVFVDEGLLPIDIDPELVERCRRLGIKLPQRMAHPDETDTSAQADTSEDGTRPVDDNTNSEVKA